MKASRNMWVVLFILGFLFCLPVKSLALGVGDKAPQFTGISNQGTIQLVDYWGKKNIVLALYFAAFTPVWTDELISFQRDLEQFDELNAQVIGVSADSVETTRKFSVENGIEFPLISDEKKSIKKRYGRGRVTYLIDKNGVIRFVQKGVPKNQDFLNELKKLN